MSVEATPGHVDAAQIAPHELGRHRRGASDSRSGGERKMKKSDLKKLAARYPKFVDWSEEDGCFVGRCPELFSGGIHGADEARVYKSLCEVAEEWVAVLHKDGAPLPKTGSTSFSGKFVVRVDPALHRRLALKAKVSGESLNALVTRALHRAS
jgi:predicted HicB family RNase H-like nuclease